MNGGEHRCEPCRQSFESAERLADHRAAVHWDEDYVPVPREELLSLAIAHLDHIGGGSLGNERVVRDGECDDCGTEGRLWRVGRFACCYGCATRRTNSRSKAA
jgi:hypothetical protein